MPRVLAIAGLYHLTWASLMILWPREIFLSAGARPFESTVLVQAIGAFVGLFGLGYLLAAVDPYRQWALVLLGLLSKILGFAGTTWLVLTGFWPNAMLWGATANDLIWIPVFGGILYGAYEAVVCHRRSVAPEVLRFALRARTQQGVPLEELTKLSPVLLVFLRHSGCPFCREALADLAARKAEIEKAGARLVLVHMGSEAHSNDFFSRYGLADAQRIADPERALYRAFGLPRGRFWDLVGPRVWVRGFQASILKRHGFGHIVGDGFQMPGAFLLYHGEILRSYRHQTAADRPDYLALVTGREYAAPELRASSN
jgi:peroxiredoxin